jgi:hypothetical protein
MTVYWPYVFCSTFRYIIFVIYCTTIIGLNDKKDMGFAAWRYSIVLINKTILIHIVFIIAMYYRFKYDFFVTSAPFDCFVTAIYYCFLVNEIFNNAFRIFGFVRKKTISIDLMWIYAPPALVVNIMVLLLLWMSTGIGSTVYVDNIIVGVFRLSPYYFSTASMLYVFNKIDMIKNGEA